MSNVRRLRMHRSRFLLRCVLCAAALGAPLLPAEAKDGASCISSSGTVAVDALRARIKSEGLYASWAKAECLSFYIESCSRERVQVAVRELHSEHCGGDPHTEPIVDRFRFYKKSRRIQWYNVVNDEYLEFSKIHSIGGR